MILPDQTQAGIVHDHHDQRNVICRCNCQFLRMEGEAEITHYRDSVLVRLGNLRAECGRNIITERTRAPRRHVQSWLVDCLELAGPNLVQSATGSEHRIILKEVVEFFVNAMRFDRNALITGFTF